MHENQLALRTPLPAHALCFVVVFLPQSLAWGIIRTEGGSYPVLVSILGTNQFQDSWLFPLKLSITK